jgi:hypothetical protein
MGPLSLHSVALQVLFSYPVFPYSLSYLSDSSLIKEKLSFLNSNGKNDPPSAIHHSYYTIPDLKELCHLSSPWVFLNAS